ncbi:MAG: class II aldolase/adducin family protein [Nanoarchaeota archaeon]
MSEGYIKFNYKWIKSNPINVEKLKEISKWRDRLYNLSLIGSKNKIGYGNISIRLQDKAFIITGSATGNLKKLTQQHYTTVIDYDFTKNFLVCKGPVIASSESLTHAAIYESVSSVNAVIHVHNLSLWKKLLDKIPTTLKAAKYGTPQLAYDIKRLLKDNAIKKRIIIMAGHKSGILTFGKDLQDAGEIILENYNKL